MKDNIKIRISDNELKKLGWDAEHDYTYEPLSISEIDNPVHSKNIRQEKIGNCAFLSAMTAILEHVPNYLSELVKIREDNLIEVTFYSIRDKNLSITYVLDPTQIIHNDLTNPHTHPLIFILEKAHALYLLTEANLVQSREEETSFILKDKQLMANEKSVCDLNKAPKDFEKIVEKWYVSAENILLPDSAHKFIKIKKDIYQFEDFKYSLIEIAISNPTFPEEHFYEYLNGIPSVLGFNFPNDQSTRNFFSKFTSDKIISLFDALSRVGKFSYEANDILTQFQDDPAPKNRTVS